MHPERFTLRKVHTQKVLHLFISAPPSFFENPAYPNTDGENCVVGANGGADVHPKSAMRYFCESITLRKVCT